MCPIEEPIVVNPPEELDIQTPSIGSVEGTRETAEPIVRNSGSENIVNPILVKEVKYLINEAILGLLPKLGFRIQKVDALPATGENGVIYLVPAEGATSPNIYEEYYWVADDNSFELIGTTEVDLSNYVDLTSAQNISGVKTFTNETIYTLTDGQTYEGRIAPMGDGLQLGTNVSPNMMTFRGYAIYVYETLNTSTIIPRTDDNNDIGTSSNRIKNLFLSGVLTDGTNSVSVADISNGIFNVINASDIASNNQLTQAQYDLITNGKPTLIKGTFRNLINPFILPPRTNIAGTITRGLYLGHASAGSQQIGTYQINQGTLLFELSSQTQGNIDYNNVSTINGKAIPAYPSNTGTFVLKCVDGVLTWVQE